MASYLEEYGEQEARRARLVKRVALAVLLVLVAAVAAYFGLRNYREKRRLEAFLDLLRRGDYQTAYTFWGCSTESPCRDYSYQKFLEDWGPQGVYGKHLAQLKRRRLHSCADGVIQILDVGDQEAWLWIDRSRLQLSYAPWPVCNPRIPASSLRGQ